MVAIAMMMIGMMFRIGEMIGMIDPRHLPDWILEPLQTNPSTATMGNYAQTQHVRDSKIHQHPALSLAFGVQRIRQENRIAC